MVFVLVIGSGAFADSLIQGLLQDQITHIGLTNEISLMHGEQYGDTMQNLVVDNEQCANGACDTIAKECMFGAIGQVASACGECALIGVAQDLAVIGIQGQAIGEGCAPKAQLQSLDLLAGQGVARADGEGGGDALHTIVLDESQYGSNPAGHMSESSTVMGMQTSHINGEPCATGMVESTMAVSTSQTQTSL
jgi:hypothetical protein